MSSSKLLVFVCLVAACARPEDIAASEQDISWGDFPPAGPTTADTPVGIALDIEDGAGTKLAIRKNQRFYINQIDMRAHIAATVDEGVAGLARPGNDFSALDWHGTAFVDESFVNLPNADGTFTRRRFFRRSAWMDTPSAFVIEQLDAAGHRRGFPLVVDTGLKHHRTPVDSFFDRRLRAIQWTFDCSAKTDCTTAHAFEEEALVELRYAAGANPNVQLDTSTTQLRVTWTANPQHPYVIPVEQIENPAWDYGFGIELAVTTPPAADGTYAPGQRLQIAFTLVDGAGTPLHPDGALPTFQDYLTGNDPAGIDYWNVFERTMTYYRRKHMEKQMVIALDGPMQDVGTIHTTIDFVNEILTSQDDAVITATPAVNGFYGEAAAVPPWPVLIGARPADTPVSNHLELTLPPDARPGTYKLAMKARRSYLGQEIPASTVITLQVGTPTATHSTLSTGPCTSCHTAGSDLSRVSHALPASQRDTCTTCHGPLAFEPETPVYVRVHFIHSRTDRLDAPLADCSRCHLNRAGIQRTSKSACLSCHKSYPRDHVTKYGPVVDMYIGGSLEDSFTQCTASCHRTHPDSHL